VNFVFRFVRSVWACSRSFHPRNEGFMTGFGGSSPF
jgi:hypothetical protein